MRSWSERATDGEAELGCWDGRKERGRLAWQARGRSEVKQGRRRSGAEKKGRKVHKTSSFAAGPATEGATKGEGVRTATVSRWGLREVRKKVDETAARSALPCPDDDGFLNVACLAEPARCNWA